ncbi:hypothetical protein ACFYRD_38485 [Streptomyces hirsutus]|uniref:hypothetical protein n=1 Tax=Streptomyces hirsutus TaxID=35620 RepID=UPI0036A4B1CC
MADLGVDGLLLRLQVIERKQQRVDLLVVACGLKAEGIPLALLEGLFASVVVAVLGGDGARLGQRVAQGGQFFRDSAGHVPARLDLGHRAVSIKELTTGWTVPETSA